MSHMEKSVMVVGVADSDSSFYVLEWTLKHFFSAPPENSLFKLVVVHARPPSSSVVGFASPVHNSWFNLIATMDGDLKKIAARVLGNAKEVCAANSVTDVKFEVVDGDARNVLRQAVDRHRASVVVVGSRALGPIKRVIVGSVSDHCAHYANCSVMIVKKPKIKSERVQHSHSK